MTRLSGIRKALLDELKGDVARLAFINTRLILSIGVNLSEIHPALDEDATTTQKTVAALRKMGFLSEESTRGR